MSTGQHNGSRVNAAPVMAVIKQGAVVANYCEVTNLHKDTNGMLTDARGVINATGPFSDALKLDSPSHQAISNSPPAST
ncbi:hypothetical protein BDQ17DRAFT_1432239 [Cyathus striatus]|nr:hypothetical protein BDQ17DRAFT_1432239 [Cyathus striatus]